MHRPELLILDEPMSGLDPIGRKLVKGLLCELRDAGTTVFFSTHILPDVEDLCDRFVMIHAGKTVAQESVQNLTEGLEAFFERRVEENTAGDLIVF